MDEIPKKVPPSHGEDDHKIDLIPGTSPPNRPPLSSILCSTRGDSNSSKQTPRKRVGKTKFFALLFADFACEKKGWVISYMY